MYKKIERLRPRLQGSDLVRVLSDRVDVSTLSTAQQFLFGRVVTAGNQQAQERGGQTLAAVI